MTGHALVVPGVSPCAGYEAGMHDLGPGKSQRARPRRR
jgi:hypothetical protein